MTASTRLKVGLALGTAALAVIVLTRPSGNPSFGPQWQQAANDERSTAPLAQCHIVLARIHARLHIVRQLGTKQLTLFEAAAQFQRLNSTPEEYPQNCWKNLPGGCDNEKVCRQVLSWARVHLGDTLPPSAAETTLCELELQLANHIAEHRKVVLPTH